MPDAPPRAITLVDPDEPFVRQPSIEAAIAALPPSSFGCVTVSSHHHHRSTTGENLGVWVDGVDVSDMCQEADDIEGYALLMAIDAARHARAMALNGVHQHADYCQIKVIGKVRIAPKA